jgi:hypothetical protein
VPPYSNQDKWRWTVLETGNQTVESLELAWELPNDWITDDYTVDDATPAELWDMWVGSIRQKNLSDSALGDDYLAIRWHVRGDSSFERAPFQRWLPEENPKDFLTYYSWPENAASNEELNFLRLPVRDKLWRPGRGDKGGFIQELTGWKPSPLQSHVRLEIFKGAQP